MNIFKYLINTGKLPSKIKVLYIYFLMVMILVRKLPFSPKQFRDEGFIIRLLSSGIGAAHPERFVTGYNQLVADTSVLRPTLSMF